MTDTRGTCPRSPTKYLHATRGAALKALEKLEAAKGVTIALEPYECPGCERWHLGHKPGSLTTKLRDAGIGGATRKGEQRGDDPARRRRHRRH